MKTDRLLKQCITLEMKNNALMKEIKDLNHKEKRYMRWNKELRSNQHFKKYDRVFILNDFVHTSTRDKASRSATVRYVKIDKRNRVLVYLVTDTGFKTYRIPVNLKRVTY